MNAVEFKALIAICLEGLRKTIKNIFWNKQSSSLDLNSESLESANHSTVKLDWLQNGSSQINNQKQITLDCYKYSTQGTVYVLRVTPKEKK